jgi:C4-type Zn-finger protein
MVYVLLPCVEMKTDPVPHVAKYLVRKCPKCAGYFGVIVSKLPYRSSIRAVSGWCKHCNYEIAWALVVTAKKHSQRKSIGSSYHSHRDT